ncbi:NAD(P)/FAD-dependent oxidoreductase [Actinomadura madurae]|uniref:NAD(P)/FAD-dependent oxidoreductase n=1 Tax=Actinomadura madurae TaxID=1993 RepID=UPI00399AA271
MTERIVVVGGSVAGLRTAEALRGLKYGGEVIVVGAEPYMPYNRTGLTKGADWPPSFGRLRIAPKPVAEDVRWLLGVEVVHADLARQVLELGDGRSLEYDALVVATGASPRRVLSEADSIVIRTLDDMRALAGRRRGPLPVVVAGGGVLGCEIAAGLNRAGTGVVVIDRGAEPMGSMLGARVGRRVRAFHEAAGVRFLSATTVEDVANGPGSTLVTLSNGERLAGATVVEALGCEPQVEWLTGNGLDLSDGVLCTNAMQVVGASNVVAAGDVARFPNPLFGGAPRRTEHWAMAMETARRAAQTVLRLLGTPFAAPASPFTPMPTFWSDQAGLRIRGVGLPRLAGRSPELLDSGVGGELYGYADGDGLVGLCLIGYLPSFAKFSTELVACRRAAAGR